MRELIRAVGLKTHFPLHAGVFSRVHGYLKAVDGVDIVIPEGQIAALVGESGCGKSTLGQSLLGLTLPSAGQLSLMGETIDIRNSSSWDSYRKEFQIIFQDPYTSLNPRQTVLEIVGEAMLSHGLVTRKEVKEKVAELLERVGLSGDFIHRYPHAFSGGQRQRIGIARAIALRPKLIVCDEIVSALDVSVQAQIIQLLLDLKADLNLSLLFIAHDLSLVRSMADTIHVMYLGRIVESGPVERIFEHPRHPYSQALLDSIPTLNKNVKPKLLPGEVPSAVQRPLGCAFAARCPRAQERCRTEDPQLEASPTNSESSLVACHFPFH